MYHITIKETWRTKSAFDQAEFMMEVDLTFIPQLGMWWEDEENGISIQVDKIIYLGENRFVVRHDVSDISLSDLQDEIEFRKQNGWKVYSHIRR